MIYIVFVIFSIISLSSIGMVIYIKFKDLKEFRGDRFVETPVARFLINLVIPKRGSDLELKYKDYLYTLNKNVTLRDFYFIKILAVFIGIIISIAICVTNVRMSYNDCFKVSKKIPIEMTSSEFESLSKDLKFDGSDSDKKILESNIRSLPDKESQYKFETLKIDTCYKYVSNMNDETSGCFGFIDFILVFGIPAFFWSIPNLIVSGLYKYLRNNSLFEYDSLETTISIMRNDKIDRVLEALEDDALYYRNLFYDFDDLYEASPADAFAVIEQHDEFSDNFKRLIRYLDMLYTQGPDYIRNIVDSNKKQTEKELKDKLMNLTNKRLRRLKLVCTISFCLSLFRVIMTLLSALMA